MRLAHDLRRRSTSTSWCSTTSPSSTSATGADRRRSRRWCAGDHRTLGLIPPLEFLPLAEEAGLMGGADALGADRRARAVRGLAQRGPPGPCLGQRLVSRPAGSAPSRASSQRCSASTTCPRGAFVLEITETTIIEEFERSKRGGRQAAGARRRGLDRRLRRRRHVAGLSQRARRRRAQARPPFHRAARTANIGPAMSSSCGRRSRSVTRSGCGSSPKGSRQRDARAAGRARM